MSKYKNPVRNALSKAASVVRDAGRQLESASKVAVAIVIQHSLEYVHTTVEAKVRELEERYPAPNQGEWKLRMARLLLQKILGSEYVKREWETINEMITLFVERMKREAAAELEKA